MRTEPPSRASMPYRKIYAEFSACYYDDECVEVNMWLPDGTREFIGIIWKEYNNINGFEDYFSYDPTGKKLFPTTSSWLKVEKEYEHYAKRLAVREVGKEKQFGQKKSVLTHENLLNEKLKQELKDIREQKVNRIKKDIER